MLQDIFFVIIGGGAGSALRFLLSHWSILQHDRFPLPTLIVNILGCFALGILSGIAYRSDVLNRHILLLLGTGLCGGFTTMSAFSIETIDLFIIGDYVRLATYLVSTFAGCTLAAYGGFIIGKSFTWA